MPTVHDILSSKDSNSVHTIATTASVLDAVEAMNKPHRRAACHRRGPACRHLHRARRAAARDWRDASPEHHDGQ